MKHNQLNVQNPYKVENFFYIVASIVMLLSALVLLLISRSAFSLNLPFLAICPLIMGIILLTLGVRCIQLVLSQTVFFLGRGEPRSLADEILATETGKGEGADAIKENLRHNSLLSNEPKGTLNGILYRWMPSMIYAPGSVQNFAVSQFHNLLASVAILLALLISWASLDNHHANAWMGLLFYCLTIYLIIRPLYSSTMNQSELDTNGLVGLILIAILAPALLPVITKNWIDISKIDFYLQSLVVLVLSLGCYLTFFIALIKQMKVPAPNTKSCEEITLSIIGHPKSFMDKIEVELQKKWPGQIPNRRYIKMPPMISNGKSEFFAELLEESQPIPDAGLNNVNYKSVISSPQHRWIVFLDILGLSLLCAGITFWLMFAVLFNPASFNFSADAHMLRYTSIGLALLILSNYCFNNGHILWSRIDFISQIIWIEMHGNYQSARLNYGNVSNDRVRSDKNITNIENMTIRIWISELKSMAFGKKLPRFITSMHGLPDQSAYLKDLISEAAISQNILPNMEQSTASVAFSKSKASVNNGSNFTGHVSIHHLINLKAPLEGICSACGSRMKNEDIFCGTCGKYCKSKI